MRSAVVLLLMALLGGIAPALARGDVSAMFAHAGAARGGQWELLTVRFQAPADGGTVEVQDARGGLTVRRSIDAAVRDPATGDSEILLPLPLLAVGELPEGSWPVVVTVRGAGRAGDAGPMAESERVEVVRRGGMGSETGTMRVACVGGAGGGAAMDYVPMSEDAILTGPLLTFASCDAVLISPRLAGAMTRDRAAGLLSTGARLMIQTNPADIGGGEGGVLRDLSWERATPADANGDGVWLTRRLSGEGYPRPFVLEPGLMMVDSLAAQAAPGRWTFMVVIGVPIAGVIGLLLARGLFHRRWLVILAMAAAMAGIAWGGVEALRGSDTAVRRTVAWSCTSAAAPESTSEVRISETFTGIANLFGQQLRVTSGAAGVAGQDEMLLPVCGSAREYFALHDIVLWLDVAEVNGLQRGSRLELVAGPRECVKYVRRTAELVAARKEDANGGSIEGGYITVGGGAPVLLTDWARAHPAIQDSLLGWYQLRFAAGHHYFLESGDSVELKDFGPK